MAALLAALLAAAALATTDDTIEDAVSEDSECFTDHGDCALHVLQKRGHAKFHQWVHGNDQDFIPATEAGIVVVGRHRLAKSGLQFDLPAVKIVARLGSSSAASAIMRQEGMDEDMYVPNAFAVYVDSKLSSTFNTSDWLGKSNVTIPLFSGLNSSETHEVTILKITEAKFNSKKMTPNYVTFIGFEVSAGTVVKAPPKLPTRKVEFLGDSITAGDCNLCIPDPVNATPTWDNEDQRIAWPSLICDALDAQCHVTAWSGNGLTLGCCKQPAPAAFEVMSKVWWRTLASEQSLDLLDPYPLENMWNFERWKPDALVINLGTNDVIGSRHQGGWKWLAPMFNATYLALVRNVVKHYGTSTHLFLACGPMGHTHCDSVKWVIEGAKAEIPSLQISYLDQTYFLNGTYGPRCCYHPSGEVHAAMASAGADFIGKAMGWLQ